MIEHLIVCYPRVRDVFVAGELVGTTNEIIRVRRASHTIDLGHPLDYRPRRSTLTVAGTTEDAPAIVLFHPK